MHLLLADDDRDSVEVLSQLLDMLAGHPRMTIAFDGMELLEAATTGTIYDAVITDIEMPRMDGATAAIEIRRALGAATPVLIAMTGHVGSAGLSRINSAFDHVLFKPLELDKLLSLLTSHQ